MVPQTMDLETVVKIEGYSVEFPEENDSGQAQSDKLKSTNSILPATLLPGPCGFQNNDLTLATAIACEEKFKRSIPNCSKSFADKHTLSLHQIYDHRENWFKCHLCESAFPIEFVLKTHLATHSTAQPYVCNICSKLCENIYDLWKHEREHQNTNNVIQASGSEKPPPLQYSDSAQIVMVKLTPIMILPTITPFISLGATASGDVVLWSKSPTEKCNELVNHESGPSKQPGMKKRVKTNRKKKEASPEKKFKCSIPNCSKSFANNSKLQAHLKNEHGQNRLFKCRSCETMWPTKSALKTHLISHATARSHHCKVCSKSFKNIKCLKIHLKNEHDQNLFECNLCGRALTNKTSYQNHLAAHSTVRPFRCNVCSQLYRTICDLRMHERKVHKITQKGAQNSGSEKQPPLQRSESSKIVMLNPIPTPLPIHLNTTPSFSSEAGVPPQDDVLGSKSYTEKISQLVQRESDPLKQPGKTNIVKAARRKEEASTTKKCEKSSISKFSKNLSRLFKCHLCEKSWPTINKLKMHLISHSTTRSYPCNVCSESFKYTQHRRVHERKVHQISLSSKEKRERRNRERHERDLLLKTQPQIWSTTTTLSSQNTTNEIETKLVQVDPTTAPQAPLLNVNPTNKCDVCLKDFKSHVALRKHRKNVHTAQNEKRHKCHVCAKSSVSSSKLKQHLYFVHGEKSEDLKIVECEFCGRQFPFVSNLETHIVAKHVVDKEFECSVCSKTFVDQDALTKHQVKNHEKNLINHFCDVCSAGFTSKINVAAHLKNFHKKLYCCKCVRSFDSKSKFNQHSSSQATLNLNAGFKLQCQVCFVSLSTQCNFNIHTDGHLREKKSSVVA